MQYIAYLHKEKKSDYGVSFPDLPGCITAGSSLEEARTMAAEALSLHLAGMLEDGEEIPKPSTLDELKDDPDMQGAVAILVEAAEPEKTVRVNITARESQIAEIDRLADEQGLTRSVFMVQRTLGTSWVKVAANKRELSSSVKSTIRRKATVARKAKTMSA